MGIKIKCHVELAILQIQEIGRTIACCEYFHINVDFFFILLNEEFCGLEIIAKRQAKGRHS